MWPGTTVLLSSLSKTIQAEHIIEISYVQASLLVIVRALLALCYIEFLLWCMCVCFVTYLVMLWEFCGLFSLKCGNCFEWWIGGYGKTKLWLFQGPFPAFGGTGGNHTDPPQDSWILAQESNSENTSLWIRSVNHSPSTLLVPNICNSWIKYYWLLHNSL